MRLWLSRNSEVPIGEQLTSQLVLGIIGEDLKPGQRLPSTRELARRLRIHSNTVSAAYRDLAQRGWVEFRRGSGVYVKSFTDGVARDEKLELDQLIASFLRSARKTGYSYSEIQARIRYWLELRPPDHFLIIDPDQDLREILAAEILEATRFPVKSASPDECSTGIPNGSAPVILYGKLEEIQPKLPSATECLLLKLRSVTGTLATQQQPSPDALITVASRWPEFLKWSRAVLVAAGVDPDALNLKDARVKGWKTGIKSSDMIIADALTAKELPAGCTPRVFRLIADSSMKELEEACRTFGESRE
jgi:DNA-binding transcriptional regulator YhcF (GntR family)